MTEVKKLKTISLGRIGYAALYSLIVPPLKTTKTD